MPVKHIYVYIIDNMKEKNNLHMYVFLLSDNVSSIFVLVFASYYALKSRSICLTPKVVTVRQTHT